MVDDTSSFDSSLVSVAEPLFPALFLIIFLLTDAVIYHMRLNFQDCAGSTLNTTKKKKRLQQTCSLWSLAAMPIWFPFPSVSSVRCTVCCVPRVDLVHLCISLSSHSPLSLNSLFHHIPALLLLSFSSLHPVAPSLSTSYTFLISPPSDKRSSVWINLSLILSIFCWACIMPTTEGSSVTPILPVSPYISCFLFVNDFTCTFHSRDWGPMCNRIPTPRQANLPDSDEHQ